MNEVKNVKIIPGHRAGGVLLWSPDEKLLYFKKKTAANGKEDWICYQEMIRKTDKTAVECTCRLSVERATLKYFRKKVAHATHENHELIYDDLIACHKIVKDCADLKVMCEGLSIDVPASDIFTRELAK